MVHALCEDCAYGALIGPPEGLGQGVSRLLPQPSQGAEPNLARLVLLSAAVRSILRSGEGFADAYLTPPPYNSGRFGAMHPASVRQGSIEQGLEWTLPGTRGQGQLLTRHERGMHPPPHTDGLHTALRSGKKFADP